MPHCLSPASCVPLIGRFRQHPHSRTRESQKESVYITSPKCGSSSSHASQLKRIINAPSTTIHDLDDDSLFYIFQFFRQSPIGIDDFEDTWWICSDQRWWYKLVQVCRRWRCLILGSASYLRLCLVCTLGTPVADMLAHSPPFPLVIIFNRPNHNLTAKDEEGVMLALRHRDRVRVIYLRVTAPTLMKLLPAMGNEFPALQYLRIAPPANHDTHFTLPPTFEAPCLYYLWLDHFTSQIGSQFLSTSTGLVKLVLEWIHPSTYPNPNEFLQQLSLMPQLDAIWFTFRSLAPNSDIERQISQSPITIRVNNPSLRLFDFKGDSGFIEAILPHMTAPLLETFRVQFFYQLHFSIPHLANFIMNTEKLRSRSVKFTFHREAVVLFSSPSVGTTLRNFEFCVSCGHLDWQARVSSATQISSILRRSFSEVGDLTLDYRTHTFSSEQHDQADHTLWRELLRPFRNVKTLRVHNSLVGEVSRSLRSDKETPLEILPELKELICPSRSVDDKTFAPFIREREDAGRPVSLIGETLPVGRTLYAFYTPTCVIYIEPD